MQPAQFHLYSCVLREGAPSSATGLLPFSEDTLGTKFCSVNAFFCLPILASLCELAEGRCWAVVCDSAPCTSTCVAGRPPSCVSWDHWSPKYVPEFPSYCGGYIWHVLLRAAVNTWVWVGWTLEEQLLCLPVKAKLGGSLDRSRWFAPPKLESSESLRPWRVICWLCCVPLVWSFWDT